MGLEYDDSDRYEVYVREDIGYISFVHLFSTCHSRYFGIFLSLRMSRAPKKSIKPSSESSKPSNLDETIRRKQEIATLETNLSNLSGESESLLTIERKLRNEIQQITSEQSRYAKWTNTYKL